MGGPDDEALAGLAKDFREAGDRDHLRRDDVGQHGPRPDRRQLIDVPHQDQAGPRRQGLDQLVHEDDVEHRRLIDDQQVHVERILLVAALEAPTLLQFRQQPIGSLDVRHARVRNGNPAAYSRRSELFPFEKVWGDLLSTETETACRSSRQVLQQHALVRGPNVDHDVCWRQQIGDFHGCSRRTHRQKRWIQDQVSRQRRDWRSNLARATDNRSRSRSARIADAPDRPRSFA